MSVPLRVGYTLEQCWHRVPGGTAVAALEVLRELRTEPALDIVGLAGSHRQRPQPAFDPGIPVVPLGRPGPALYARWLAARRPVVERGAGPLDVVHATTIIPPPCRAPLVVTIHDLAFLHDPAQFTRWGVAVFRRSLAEVRRRATLVLCSSQATADDCVAAGVAAERLRVVPLGVRRVPAPTPADIRSVRKAYGLPERFVLFVGTLEPRKNLHRLAEAVARSGLGMPLAVVGPEGWGGGAPAGGDVRFCGFVGAGELTALYAAATIFAYPSEREGFGLPVAEAMAQGTPVVTSTGTSTAEVAGDAAVLVDPRSVDEIAAGLHEALRRAGELAARGRRRAAELSWARTAGLTIAAYREVVR